MYKIYAPPLPLLVVQCKCNTTDGTSRWARMLLVSKFVFHWLFSDFQFVTDFNFQALKSLWNTNFALKLCKIRIENLWTFGFAPAGRFLSWNLCVRLSTWNLSLSSLYSDVVSCSRLYFLVPWPFCEKSSNRTDWTVLRKFCWRAISFFQTIILVTCCFVFFFYRFSVPYFNIHLLSYSALFEICPFLFSKTTL